MKEAQDHPQGGVRRRDKWCGLLTLFLFFLTGLLFAPLSLWLARQTVEHEQLVHALVILALAVAALYIEENQKFRFYGRWDGFSWGAMAGAFVLLGIAFGLHSVVGLVPALALVLMGWGGYFLGPGQRRAVVSLAVAFGGFLVLALLAGKLDWPLRVMAGSYAHWVLEHLGFFTGLQLATGDQGGMRLILIVDGFPFEVAAECNGFGLLGASFLLALLLAVYRPMALVDRLLLLASAGMLATLFNLLRIVTICVLAPSFAHNYWAMHEVVGNIWFWSCITLLWWMGRSWAVRRNGVPRKSNQ